MNATGPCRGHSRSSKINDTLPFALRSHVWLVAHFRAVPELQSRSHRRRFTRLLDDSCSLVELSKDGRDLERWSKESCPERANILTFSMIPTQARFIWILLHHDTHKQLEAGFVENVPAFFGTPPCDLIISQLKKKGYNVLVHVRVPMTQLKIPSLRERTILRFWRAAPGETPKVTVRKRLVVS